MDMLDVVVVLMVVMETAKAAVWHQQWQWLAVAGMAVVDGRGPPGSRRGGAAYSP